jgi:hypothetical protein
VPGCSNGNPYICGAVDVAAVQARPCRPAQFQRRLASASARAVCHRPCRTLRQPLAVGVSHGSKIPLVAKRSSCAAGRARQSVSRRQLAAEMLADIACAVLRDRSMFSLSGFRATWALQWSRLTVASRVRASPPGRRHSGTCATPLVTAFMLWSYRQSGRTGNRTRFSQQRTNPPGGTRSAYFPCPPPPTTPLQPFTNDDELQLFVRSLDKHIACRQRSPSGQLG